MELGASIETKVPSNQIISLKGWLGVEVSDREGRRETKGGGGPKLSEGRLSSGGTDGGSSAEGLEYAEWRTWRP